MSNFFQRWSKLKQSETVAKEEVTESPVDLQIDQTSIAPTDNHLSESSVEVDQGPTMADVENLTKDSDFSGFTATGANDEVHHAAMKKLFSDPHYNVMDGLDIYIGDYSKEDPLPAGMLEKMVQSSMLGLFKKVEEKLPDIVLTENQPNLDVNEETPKVTHEVTENISQHNQEDQTTMTKGSIDDSDTRL